MPELLETQKRAAEQVLNTLDAAPIGSVVYLAGIRGTGKSLVISSIADEITARGATVEEYLESRLGSRSKVKKQVQEGKVVTFGTIREGQLLAQTLERNYPEIRFYPCDLPALNMPESLALVRLLRKDGSKTVLSDLEVATYSLGIPLLIDRLSSDPAISTEAAQQVSGHHIGVDLCLAFGTKGLDKGVKRFLQIAPSVPILEAAANTTIRSKEHIYDNLGRILGEMGKIQGEGVAEESPLFITGESVEMYTKMLRSKDAQARIEIFAPEISKQDVVRAAQALGLSDCLDYPSKQFIKSDISHAIQIATRAKMFGWMLLEGYRKTAIWLRTPDHREAFCETESEVIRNFAQNAEKDFLGNVLPLRPTQLSSGGRLYFHRHAHCGEAYAPAYAGWMVESLLQQRGISYMVNNATLGQTYVYNAEKQAIEYAAFDITRQTYEF